MILKTSAAAATLTLIVTALIMYLPTTPTEPAPMIPAIADNFVQDNLSDLSLDGLTPVEFDDTQAPVAVEIAEPATVNNTVTEIATETVVANQPEPAQEAQPVIQTVILPETETQPAQLTVAEASLEPAQTRDVDASFSFYEESASLSENSSPQDIARAIASLQAQLDIQQQAYANRPRRYTISSASTQRRYDALYFDNWRQRIELVGNERYPDEARQNEIFGSLRMMVTIRPDGAVADIRVLQGSGHQVLDQAAVDFVRLASPFDAFPDELRGSVDLLEIIHTWRFRPENAFGSQ